MADRRPIILMTTTMHDAGMTPAPRGRRGSDGLPDRPGGPAPRGRRRRRDRRPHGGRLRCRADGRRRARLRVSAATGSAYDHVDVPAATERGILVVTTPGANTEASPSTSWPS